MAIWYARFGLNQYNCCMVNYYETRLHCKESYSMYNYSGNCIVIFHLSKCCCFTSPKDEGKGVPLNMSLASHSL